MSHATSDLSVRRHQRVLCELSAQVAVAAESEQSLRLARSVLTSGGMVPAKIVDCSLGGLGLQTRVFLPQASHLCVNLVPPGGGDPVRVTVRVQRAAMTDRTPTYYIGTAFDGDDAARDEAVGRLIDQLKNAGATVIGGKASA